MKNLFFILGAMAIISCSEEDSDQRANFDYTFLTMEKTQINVLAAYPHLSNGDTISKTQVETNAEKMTFEILEETVPGAVMIDPETGIITVNDAELFMSDINLNEPNMAVTVKASAGIKYKIQKQYFKIYDVSSCEGSFAFLEQSIFSWMQRNGYNYKEVSMDAAQFSFVVPEYKKLCEFSYINDYIPSDVASKLHLVFTDEKGSEIFNAFIESSWVENGFGYSTLYYERLDLPLMPNKKYTCSIRFESNTKATIIEGGTSSALRFPINRSLYKITETKLLDGNSNLQNTGLIPIVFGFE